MDRKTFTIILAVVLIGCFFLPYYKFLGAGVSGYDFVFKTGGDSWEMYIWLLVPVPGLLLLLGALNKENYILGRGLLLWLPLLALIYMLIVGPMIHGTAIGDTLKAIGKDYGIGLWITIAASLVLAFYNPKAKA